jgi:hypothetical protein
MTTNKSPSLVLDTMDAVFALYESYEWQPHPRTGVKPKLIYGDDADPTDEEICLIGVPPGDRTNARWATNLSQDETFTLRVIIFSRVPGSDRGEVVARLKVLANTAQIAFRDQTSGRMAGGLTQAVPGLMTYLVSGFAPRFFAGPEGLCGDCEIDITFTARL